MARHRDHHNPRPIVLTDYSQVNSGWIPHVVLMTDQHTQHARRKMADLVDAYGSQLGLAQATGLSQATISRFARGIVSRMSLRCFATLQRAGAQAERPVTLNIADFLPHE